MGPSPAREYLADAEGCLARHNHAAALRYLRAYDAWRAAGGNAPSADADKQAERLKALASLPEPEEIVIDPDG